MGEAEISSIVRIEARVSAVDIKLDMLIAELLGRPSDPGRIPKIEQKLEDCELFRERVRGISIAVGGLLTLLAFLHKFGLI